MPNTPGAIVYSLGGLRDDRETFCNYFGSGDFAGGNRSALFLSRFPNGPNGLSVRQCRGKLAPRASTAAAVADRTPRAGSRVLPVGHLHTVGAAPTQRR